MSVVIKDEIWQQADMSEAEFKLELGIFLYAKNILPLGKASEFVGIPQLIFQQEIAKRGLFISYDEEEFQKDLKTIRAQHSTS